MQLINLKHPDEQQLFAGACLQGLGRGQGLFFPAAWPAVNMAALLSLPRAERHGLLLQSLLGDEFDAGQRAQLLAGTFDFPAPLVEVEPHCYALELFHGPTLAFKDFGARFLARCLSLLAREPVTILTATSGDTGAAVAHAFHGLANVQVVVLYPRGRISALQERLFCTLGGNVHTLAVDGSFDDCQALVKKAFDDAALVGAMGLNSANSINIARLLAQVFYYVDAVAQLPPKRRESLLISVPCGNFGNLTAGLIAKALGLPVDNFVVATNANDTVPRYLASGQWQPAATVPTLANAMDVSRPNNWPRVEALLRQQGWSLAELKHGHLDDAAILDAVHHLDGLGYQAEPHGAIAYELLRRHRRPGQTGIFLATAHPAKFADVLEERVGLKVPLPDVLSQALDRPLLSRPLANDFGALRSYLKGL
ncbi:threonine synthase [Gallaecimonas sp. GXIMD4217]|uniref:threonine synthase n=1 Tax=Gallaecimonas sp. GXIMD4217 TaxID=3131927 RepID=UPI00311AD61B